jgi:hypothetical protein
MTTHDCPGGCGAPVVRHRFACGVCWRRLPAQLRRAITSTYNVDHTAHARAMVRAMHWYCDIPLQRKGAPSQ